MPTQTESPDVVLIGAGISITRTRSSYHARCTRRFLAHASSYWPTGFHASEAYPVTAGVAVVQPRDTIPPRQDLDGHLAFLWLPDLPGA